MIDRYINQWTHTWTVVGYTIGRIKKNTQKTLIIKQKQRKTKRTTTKHQMVYI